MLRARTRGTIALVAAAMLLPLASQTASANYMGWLTSDVMDTNNNIWLGNPSDTWDFSEILNNHVAVMMRPDAGLDLRIWSNAGGGGALLAVSQNGGNLPDVCVWNGNGAGAANTRDAEIWAPGGANPGYQYDIEYQVSTTISPNTVMSYTFQNNNDMMDVYQAWLQAGTTYTIRFWSVSNSGADYAFYVFRLGANAWGNLANIIPGGMGGFSYGTYTSVTVTPAAAGVYGIVVLANNQVTSNYQFVVGAPDLTVSGLVISNAPVNCGGVNVMPQNRPYTYYASIYNQGYGDAGFTWTTMSLDGAAQAMYGTPALGARSSTTSSSFSYNTANPDTHYLTAQADSGNAVPEDGIGAEANNVLGRYDAVAEDRAAYTNDNDDGVPSPRGFSYFFYCHYLHAGDSQKFAAWTAAANTDFDLSLYSPTGGLLTTATSTGYPEWISVTATASGYHYIAVTRVAGAGSAYTFGVDDAAPTIQVVQPTEGKYLLGNYQFRLNVQDMGSGVSDTASNPVYRVDGGSWADIAATVANGYNYIANWNTLGVPVVPDGTHSLEFLAFDNAGNLAYQQVTVTVDNTAPYACSLVYPTAGKFLEGAVTFKVLAGDLVGLDRVSLSFGGNLAGLATQPAAFSSGSGYHEYSLDTTPYPDGTASVSPTAADRAGNLLSQPPTSFIIDNLPPKLSITGPVPDAFVSGNAVALTATASDAAGTLSVSYIIDGGSATSMAGAGGAFSASWDSTTASDGPHVVTIRAADGAGHVTEQSVKVTVDNADPTCSLVSPLPSQFIEGRFLFKVSAWDANGISSVDMDVMGIDKFTMAYNAVYNLYERELDTTLYQDALYSLSVVVTDRASAGGIRAPVLLQLGAPGFYIDNVAPVLRFLSPTPDEYVSGVLTLQIEASDQFLSSMAYSVDGGPRTVMSTNTTSWDTRTVPDGRHAITFQAHDTIGHSNSASITVMVDNHAPRLYWGTPDEGTLLSGVYAVKVKALDEVGILSVILRLGAREYPMTLNLESGYHEYPLDTTSLLDGEWQLDVVASELAGQNPDATSSRSVRVDNNAPLLMIFEPFQGEVLGGPYAFNYSAEDVHLQTVEFRVDALGWMPVEAGWNTTRHPDGFHVLSFRAVDLSGRTTEMTLTVMVDNSRPACLFTAPVNDSFASATVLLELHASDAAGLASVTVEGPGAQPLVMNPVTGMYSSELDTSALADGTYSYSATATDLAGRTTTARLVLKVDNHPPDLSVQVPEDMAHLTGELEVQAEAPDAFDAVLEYQLDSLGWRALNRTFDTALLADGAHGLSVRATDGSGKVSTVQLIVYLDNSPPLVSVLEPAAELVSIRGQFNLRVAVGEGDGVREISYTLDGGLPAPLVINRATGYYEQALATSGLSDGIVHSVAVTVKNQAGLTTVFTRQFRVDNTAPEVKIISPTPSAQKGLVSIVVEVTDATGVAEVMLRLDGGQWKEMVLTKRAGRFEHKWATDVGKNGDHAFEIRVTDTLGNRATTVHSFRVENPDYGWVVGLVIVVIIAVAAVVLMVRGRKKRSAELGTESPPPAAPSEEELPSKRAFPDGAPGPEPPVRESPPREADEAPMKPVPAPSPLEEITAQLRAQQAQVESRPGETETRH